MKSKGKSRSMLDDINVNIPSTRNVAVHTLAMAVVLEVLVCGQVSGGDAGPIAAPGRKVREKLTLTPVDAPEVPDGVSVFRFVLDGPK